MKQVSTLFDALRNEKFAIAVKDAYGIKYYGYDGQGKEWAAWANKVEVKSLEDSQIPSGIIQGPYKNISDNDLKSLIVAFGYGDVSASNFVKSKSYRHASSVRIKSASIVPAVMDTPINYFTGYQYSPAVSYKCLSMRHNIKEGSFLHEARANNYAFNFNKWMYNAAPETSQNKSLRQRVDQNVGRSSERRLGMKLKSAALGFDNKRKNVGASGSLETKSLSGDLEFKQIGQRIGGGTRAARRAARGMMARFDPKAWDGDGDGIVQEGTPYQRPAIPGVNDRASGGSVDTSAATRAWQNFSVANRPGTRRRTRTSDGTRMQSPSGSPTRARTPGGKPRAIAQSGRSTSPVSAQSRGVSKRVTEARAQRQIQGFAARSGKSAARRRPGVDKMRETDGQLFNALDAEQKDIVTSNLRKRYQKIQDEIKGYLGNEQGTGLWWEEFLAKGSKKIGAKTDADGKPWTKESRLSGEALRSLELAVEGAYEEIDNEIATVQTAIQKIQGLGSLADESDDKKLKSLQTKLKKLEREKATLQENIQDLIVLDSMYEKDNWEMVEHLSAQSRSAGFGRTMSGAKLGGMDDPFEGKDKPKINWKEPSSFFTDYEQYREGKRAIVGKEKTGKLKKFSDRLIENAEAAKEKRQLRKQRRGRALGLDAERGETSLREKARRKFARTARKIKRKIKGGANEKTINTEIKTTKEANPTVFGNGQNGSTPKINSEGITKLAALFRGKDDPKTLELLKEQKGQNAGSDLGNTWTAQGYNALPTKISRDDAEYLAGQGWMVIQRGHGTPKPPDNNKAGEMRFIMDYLEDPDRFITGEGGAAYGPGEYWSRPGTDWDGWVPSAGGTLAVVSPDTRLMTITQAKELRSEHRKLWSKVNAALQEIGGGTLGAKDIDPQDLVKELKSVLGKEFADGDPMWSSEVGQVLNSLFKFMETAPPSQREDIWDAIQYMTSLGGLDEHFSAMAYGYDGVDHQGRAPVVWFNRGALAVVDDAMSVKDMREVADIAKKAA